MGWWRGARQSAEARRRERAAASVVGKTGWWRGARQSAAARRGLQRRWWGRRGGGAGPGSRRRLDGAERAAASVVGKTGWWRWTASGLWSQFEARMNTACANQLSFSKWQSFISIDCGYITTPSYTDGNTGITYSSDEGFTDAGLIHPVDKGNLQGDLADRYLNIRYFPSGERNCYTLRSLTPGGKYLVRAAFGYGDYDKLNSLPTFDLYFGVNYWTTVTIVNSSTAYLFEIIAVSPAEFVQICLVNIESGTPFISGLDLRSLSSDLYPEANVTQSLVLLSYFRDTVGFGPNRYHFGTNYQHIRFPDDPFDRVWQRYEDVPSWTDVPNKSDGAIHNSPNDTYDAPSAVLRSASTPVNASRMDISWSSDSSMSVGVDPTFFLVLYFAEVEVIQELRQFDVSVDNNQLASAFSPKFLLSTVLSRIVQGSDDHSVSLVATSNSALQPVISAMEIYMVRPVNESTTDSLDANAMMTIQTKFSVKRNWVGDPCAPISFAWDGLNCSYTSSSPPRITGLNLSYNGLVGEIDASFGQLTLLQHLDLSHNSLSGSIPDFLGRLSSLKFLDLSSNNLSGSIPWSLLEKSQQGSFTLRLDNNPSLCGNNICNPTQNKKKNKAKLLQIVIPVIAAAVVVLLLVAVFVHVIWRRIKSRPDVSYSANPLENRRFSYKELKRITNNFNTKIGEGGFGFVYAGRLENGVSVAVKMRSEESLQGNTEFLAEAQHLARIHHRNLVSLIGYCKDKKHLSLVYECMDGGNLQDRLIGQVPLNWLQRLKIALDSANGLEYLHKSCSPPLIHRDVKTRNILLTANLDAKLSDFGLTRAFSSETMTHTTTQPAGTMGYLDPEYLATSHLSEKSDVYSFGIVLLVLITGQPVIINTSDTERTNVALWARHRLHVGDIDTVTDPTIREDCDINSVWKVVEVALRCTERVARDRPTMGEVVEGISESLQLEMLSRSMRSSSMRTGSSAFADGDSVGALEAELIGETSAR
ncbi:probable LRR receptor-like serine/threonine-protein kinase At1g05700 [Lolium perenne]|uniref:probable LRR receptor-like serine/threonine-protein kinase At1g05700 n=1 Tax=Lolium perenne TaxID=4522 RepID=UPI003A99CDC2